MKIASVENENGVSSLLNVNFDQKEVEIDKIDEIDDLLFTDLSVYDLILVDMSHDKCLDFIYYLKQKAKAPIIYLTDRSKENPWELELDDREFITHSYSREEFVNEVFKQVNKMRKTNVVEIGNLSLEEENGIFRVRNNILDLNDSEISICAIFIENMGEYITDEFITKELVKKGKSLKPSSIPLKVKNIKKQFKKVNLDPIEKKSNLGYAWVLDTCNKV